MNFAYDINYDIKYSFDETYVNKTFPYDLSFPYELKSFYNMSQIDPYKPNMAHKIVHIFDLNRRE